MISLPRLYVNDKFSRVIHPINVSITQNIIPLSTANMTIPMGEKIPARSYVELFTPYGSAGMFRVRSPHTSYGMDYSTAELEHMIAEVGDYVYKADTEEMIPASTAVQTVFSHYKGKRWKLGSYSAIGNGTIALEAQYESVLSVLLSILEQKPECMMKFDFSSTPWKLNIVKRGQEVVSEGRLSRNVTSATVTYDDSELVTRVWYQTYYTDEEGKKQSTWVSKDANTIKTYGLVEASIHTQADMTPEEINLMVNTYLAQHKQPRTSVQIQADELYRITGERVDKFLIGDLFRLAIPDYKITVELNITSMTWGNVYNNPKSVTVQLGDEEDTVVTFLHNLDATGSGTTGGAGGGGGAGKQAQEWSEFRSDWQVLNDKIYGYVERVDKHDNILEQAGLYINSKGVLTYAHDYKTNIMAKIDLKADQIMHEVKQGDNDLKSTIKQTASNIRLEVKDVNDKLTAQINVNKDSINLRVRKDGVISAINQTAEQITISASKINLSGYVTTWDLESVNATIANLTTGITTASSLKATAINAISGFTYQGHGVAFHSVTIGGTAYHLMGYQG